MPLSRSQKEELVKSYSSEIAAAPHVFLMGYKGIDVPQVTDLRSKVRESGARYTVVKNTLLQRSIEGAPLEGLKDRLEGPIAVAYCDDDPVGLAKVLTEFAKGVPAIEFMGGLVEGRAVDAGEIEEIAKLPSREELITKLAYLLSSPVVRLARALGDVSGQFARVLEQVRLKKEQESAGA